MKAAVTILLISLYCLGGESFAQKNEAARYEIDAKRIGVNPTDKDALPRSREFIRLDNTYYVGYLFEGMYKADRSVDYEGFKNAIPPLKKALALFEKDYKTNLQTIFTNPQLYVAFQQKFTDYLYLNITLRECYENTDHPDSTIWLLNKMLAYKFPKDLIGIYSMQAWTYHRNRFFTSKDFSFLKNSVQENEQMAYQKCTIALKNIDKNKPQNDLWFGPQQAQGDKQRVYFYLAMLDSYNQKYASSQHYYDALIKYGGISWNNYASFKHELGQLPEAYQYYTQDKYKGTGFNLHEPYYYLSILEQYAGRTQKSIQTTQEIIQAQGITPGFGWYNIALARSFMYDGQLDSAEIMLNKAAHFKEVHIGTTLTQSQYNFTVNLLKLQLIKRKMQLIKFLDRGWWYSPTNLYSLLKLRIDKFLIQYVLINQFSTNPDRERLVYDLFCSESTDSFDELLYMLSDLSPHYLQKKYETILQTDQRKKILPYFKLVKNIAAIQDGQYAVAKKELEQLRTEITNPTVFDNLLLARINENILIANQHLNSSTDETILYIFNDYPQLVPYCETPFPITLQVEGTLDKVTHAVLKEFKQCNFKIDATHTPSQAPHITIQFNQSGSTYQATLHVKTQNGKGWDKKLFFKQSNGVGQELALRVFGKSVSTQTVN